MKRGFVLGFITAIIFSSIVVYGSTLVTEVYLSKFPVKVNDMAYSPIMPVLNYQGRTYLALREFATITDNTVDFSNNTILVNCSEKENAIVPEQVNWAKFCGDYAEIQAAVSVATAETYGNAMLDSNVTTKPRISDVLKWVCTTPAATTTLPALFPKASGTVTIQNDNHLGVDGINFNGDWIVDSEGILYYTKGVPNPYDGNIKYKTPTDAL
jgi:hypothetical protein